MKKILELNVNLEPLLALQFGLVKAQLVMSAIDLKIFDYTVQPVSSDDVAAAIKTNPRNTKFFLNALVSIGLLKKNDGKFWNTEVVQTFLVQGKETYLGLYFQLNEQFMFQSREQMTEAIINGPQARPEGSRMDGDFFANYIDATCTASLSGVSQSVAKALANLPEFSGFRKMLDLGGGHGLDCIAAVQKHPSMIGVVYDMPAVIEVTKGIISSFGMENRMSVMGGDYTTDSIGDGYDLVYTKWTLNFAGPMLNQVIKKAYNALNDGGVLVAIHEGLTNEETQPEGIVISWLQTALTSPASSLAKHVVPDAVTNAGFVDIEIFTLDFPMGEVDMIVGRKYVDAA